jgi:hypothetical protein
MRALKEWSKIKDGAVEIMTKQKQLIEEQEHRDLMRTRATVLKDVLNKYFSDLPFNHTGPAMGDIASFSVFRSILLDTPHDVEVAAESFANVMAELPALSEEWRVSKTAELLELFGPGISESDLSLAVNQFHCSICSQGIPYSRVFVHSCFLNGEYQDGISEDRRLCESILGRTWSVRNCRPPRKERWLAFLPQCNLDPSSATLVDLLASEVIVELEQNCRGDRHLANVAWVVSISAFLN